ncbi:MAG: hypothetical protein ACQEUC_11145 [Pseudomonadota bacterium]
MMEIHRFVSRGSAWPVATAQLPALLEVVDERQIPVEFSLDPGSGQVSVQAESVRYRSNGPRLVLDAAGSRIRIDLERVVEARVVSRAQGSRRRLGVQLLGADGTVLLALTGPEAGSGLASDVWQLVVEAMLPTGGRGGRHRSSPSAPGWGGWTGLATTGPASGRWQPVSTCLMEGGPLSSFTVRGS